MTEERGLMCGLNVPLNRQGIVEFEEDLSFEWRNIFHQSVTTDQFELLAGDFNDWCNTFDLMIELCEEETLPAGKTVEAMKILERHMRERKDEPDFLKAAKILKTALAKAIELNMPLYMDF